MFPLLLIWIACSLTSSRFYAPIECWSSPHIDPNRVAPVQRRFSKTNTKIGAAILGAAAASQQP
ncbi:MAG TPA: hypothetical protein VMN57_06230, partial [Anaerolineales bacterium]|nr:hypothetical protein [Anaerolineales bacterium]